MMLGIINHQGNKWKLQSESLMQLSKWLKWKTVTTLNTGEDAEITYTLLERVLNGTATLENNLSLAVS